MEAYGPVEHQENGRPKDGDKACILERVQPSPASALSLQKTCLLSDQLSKCIGPSHKFSLRSQMGSRTNVPPSGEFAVPADDMKLHSRIFDLSSGDLLAEAESSRSVTQSRPGAELHECQPNAKSGTPALKCPSLGLVIPGALCPRTSFSSSELSLSSTCSEHSSGSSCTWHDGKNLRKRQSSQNWDKRLSIDSSLPSGFASPTDELPPSRVKESHILEGLRKLQKRKVLLEPPSVITKWGYKDCMNSNEGIYSPGIKSSSLKERSPHRPPGANREGPRKAFVCGADSHDAEEDSSSLAFLQVVPNQGCRLHSCKLTHSVSDSLFGWDLNGKHLSEGTSSVYPRERPEKLTRCASSCPVGTKLCPSVHVPQAQRESDPCSQGHRALGLQLSDTEDDTLDELHIDSSDGKSPSDLSLTADTDKSVENLDHLTGSGKSDKERKQVPIPVESRPKTFSFIKQQRVVKRTSSEECITVIFDAEDGEPIEFSSHQAGVLTVTRDDISISQAPAGPKAEHAELSPQGIPHLQPRAAARNYAFLKTPEEKTENIPRGDVGNAAAASAAFFSPSTVTQNTQRQRLARPTHSMPCQSDSRSSVSMGMYPKQSLTKIPARGKSSPQKSKLMQAESTTRVPSSGPVTLEKSPTSAPSKLLQAKKIEGLEPLADLQPDSHIPKHPTQPPHSSKMSSRRDWAQCSKSPGPVSQPLSRPLTEPGDNEEPPTRDKRCDAGPEAGVGSPSHPPHPARSVSLLRPSDDCLPPPAKPEARVPSETARTVFKSPPLKGSSGPIISSNLTVTEVPGKKPSMAFKKPIFTHPLPSTETGIQTRCSAHTPSSSFTVMAPGPPKVSPKRGVAKTPPHQTLGATHTDPELRTPKSCPAAQEPLETLSSRSVGPGRQGQLKDSISTSPRPSVLGLSESPPAQGNSPSSSPASRSRRSPHGCLHAHEKGLTARLPAALRVLTKSPQLLRKSSTVPGKHEKDSLNEASRSSVAVRTCPPEDSGDAASPGTPAGESSGAPLGPQAQDGLAGGLLEAAVPEALENGAAAGKDGLENRSVKRSLSSSKPHPKPALGMNGAKARSQSFSARSGDKPPTPPVEGPGKVRTQIITTTAERGSSLTRQSSSTEGSPHKTPAAPDSPPRAGRPLVHPSSRQSPLGSTDSPSSQHGSPCKLLWGIPPRSAGPLAPAGVEDQQACPQGGGPRGAVPAEPGSDHCRCPPTPADCPQALQSPGRTQRASNAETSRTPKLETSGRYPDNSTTRTGAVSPEAPLSPTIEEKVMLCIQENVEKGQVQTKSTSVEAKPKPGPSFASWFGFRRSRLPALSSRKMDVSKVERKDAKGLGFGNKQLKSERKKERKNPALQLEIENGLRRDSEVAGSPGSGLQSKNHLKTPLDIYHQMTFEPRSRPSPVMGSTKDTFLTELLNRVDKKAVHQTENGSDSVTCRSVLKGSSQGSGHTCSSTSPQGNHKKNIKTKADLETPKGSLMKEANENLQDDEEDTVADSTFQSHIIGKNSCLHTCLTEIFSK
ncbi:hypothetical protein MC885_010701 [Smutsia gigantea]|nr:hypothetical protein MC885_010701 [Smutsia gigantea]